MAGPFSDGDVWGELFAKEVREFVDRSTGILTIYQMEWLAQAVSRHGLTSHVLSPAEYKRIYLDRLMVSVRQRIARLHAGAAVPSDFVVAGSHEFTRGLADRGVRLYLASGTDHEDVVAESGALGLLECFEEPRVLNGDHGLTGECLQECYLLVGKRPNLVLHHGEDANGEVV